MDQREKRELMNGFGNGLARAFEMAATPAIFVVVGLYIDEWLDTSPFFAVGLAMLSMVGMFLRSWFSYSEDMRAQEEGKPWQPKAHAPRHEVGAR